jgi:hypothetical protein
VRPVWYVSHLTRQAVFVAILWLSGMGTNGWSFDYPTSGSFMPTLRQARRKDQSGPPLHRSEKLQICSCLMQSFMRVGCLYVVRWPIWAAWCPARETSVRGSDSRRETETSIIDTRKPFSGYLEVYVNGLGLPGMLSWPPYDPCPS